MFFCSLNLLSGGGVNVNHNATHSPSLARKNKTENDSRLLKNSEGNRDDEWYFCRGQEADIAIFFQDTRIRKIRKIFIASILLSHRLLSRESGSSYISERTERYEYVLYLYL